MAVVQATIKSQLATLFTNAKNSAMTEDDFADGMATIIADAIKSGTVSVTAVTPGQGTATGTIS